MDEPVTALPSILQNALAPRRPEREGSRSRVLLCGSAMTFMGTLLAGNAPLRGRAGLELVVPTLDYQLAAQFWNVTDPALAIKVHAIVGGTPAYRREFVGDLRLLTPADLYAGVLLPGLGARARGRGPPGLSGRRRCPGLASPRRARGSSRRP